jgi:HAMP domain-containing protein
MIQEKAIDVASQVEIYIKSHQRFKKEDLVKDPWFKAIAIQKVGETGYTSVHDDKGVSYSNITPQIVGRNLRQFYEKSPVFWKILEASLKGPASGYYDWKDADGRTRLKYIFLAPVKDTDLIVASTTYIDEFSKPVMGIGMRMNQIEKKYLDEFDKRLQTFYIVMMIGSIVLFLAIYLFSRSVIHPLRSLSEVADRISMGELDVPIPTATGEVGVLAKSIERMQTSVKVAIERLQRRREQK